MKTSISHSSRRSRRLLTTAALLGALALTGCSGDDPAEADPDDPTAGLSEIEAQGDEECPTELVQPEGSAADEPAAEAPTLQAPESAFVCLYDPVSDQTRWQLSDEPVPVGAKDLRAITRQLAMLEPAKDGRSCSGKSGSRWLLMSTTGDDLTGVVVDDFGCTVIRLCGVPFRSAPGEATQDGTVTGVPSGDDVLLNQLKLVYIDS